MQQVFCIPLEVMYLYISRDWSILALVFCLILQHPGNLAMQCKKRLKKKKLYWHVKSVIFACQTIKLSELICGYCFTRYTNNWQLGPFIMHSKKKITQFFYTIEAKESAIICWHLPWDANLQNRNKRPNLWLPSSWWLLMWFLSLDMVKSTLKTLLFNFFFDDFHRVVHIYLYIWTQSNKDTIHFLWLRETTAIFLIL